MATVPTQTTRTSFRLRAFLQDRVYTLALTIGLVGMGAAIAFPQTFPTFGILSQIVLNLSIDTIVAVGMLLLLVSGVFDLSVGSVVAFAGGLAAYLMFFWNWPVPLAILAGLGASKLLERSMAT